MTYKDEVLVDNPLYYFELDETASPLTNSGSAAGTATANSGITLGEPGVSDMSGYFNGSATAFASPASASLGTTWSFETWMKVDGAAGTRTLFRHQVGSTNYVAVTVDTGTGYFRVYDYSGVNSGVTVPEIVDGGWHHLAVVRTGTYPQWIMYVDGVEVGNFNGASAAKTGWVNLSYGTSSDAWKGWIDGWALYTTTLPAARVLAHYEAGTGGGVVNVSIPFGIEATAAGDTGEILVDLATDATAPFGIEATASGVAEIFGRGSSFFATADTYTKSGVTTDQSATGGLEVTNTGRAWMKFDQVPSLAPGEQILSAKLSVRSWPGPGVTSDTWQWQVSSPSADWSASTIRHTNAPATTLVASGTVTVSSDFFEIQLDVTDWLESVVAGTTTNHGLVFEVTAYDFGGGKIYSTESVLTGNDPRLMVTIGTPVNVTATMEASSASANSGDLSASTVGNVVASLDAATANASSGTMDGLGEISPNVTMALEAVVVNATSGTITASSPVYVDFAGATATAESGGMTVSVVANASQAWNAVKASAVLVPAVEWGNKFDDDYYWRILDYPGALSFWYRLDEKEGSGALDERTAADNPRTDVAEETYDEIVGTFDRTVFGPVSRRGVHFEDAYLDRFYDQSSLAGERWTFEVTLKTTSDGVLALSVDESSITGSSEWNIISIQDGRLTWKNYAGQTATGLKNIADGQWHHVVVTGVFDDIQTPSVDAGIRFYVDGTLDARRWYGITSNRMLVPDYLFGAPLDVQQTYGVTVDSLDAEVMEVLFRDGVALGAEDVTKNYYAAFGIEPIEWPIPTATATAGAINGKGNQKRALYLYQASQLNYNAPIPEGDPWTSPLIFDNGDITPTAARDLEPKDWSLYKVFAKSITGYRDERTDRPRLINLQTDVNASDYDLIIVGTWPESGKAMRRWFVIGSSVGNNETPTEDEMRKSMEDFAISLREAVAQGANLLVTSPRLAADLKIVNDVEWHGQGYGLGDPIKAKTLLIQDPRNFVRDRRSWVIDPFNGMAGDAAAAERLEEIRDEGAYDPEDKQFYDYIGGHGYVDTHRINRHRVVRLVNGLTDLPTSFRSDQIYRVTPDPVANIDRTSIKFEERPEGLHLGDEMMIEQLADFGDGWGYPDLAVPERYIFRYRGVNGFWSIPPTALMAGKAVTVEADKHWAGAEHRDNPQAGWITSAVIEPEDEWDGRPAGGKVFISITEPPILGSYLTRQTWPDGASIYLNHDFTKSEEVTDPTDHLYQTPEQMEWDWSEERWLTRSGSVDTSGPEAIRDALNELVDRILGADGEGSSSGLLTVTIYDPFETYAVKVHTMLSRGLVWLASEWGEDGQGNTNNNFGTAAADAEVSISGGGEKNNEVLFSPARAHATLVDADEFYSPEAEVFLFPAEATGSFGGLGKKVSLEPATATASFGWDESQMYQGVDYIDLTIHSAGTVTLFIKEDT